MMRNPSLRARLISSPSNFNHLVHVGPSEKQHQLQDLHLVSHRGSAYPLHQASPNPNWYWPQPIWNPAVQGVVRVLTCRSY